MLLVLTSCATKTNNYHSFNGVALGTTYSIIYEGDKDLVTQKEVEGLLAEFSKSASIFDSTSLLSQINRGETDSLTPSLERCILVAQKISEQSDGCYDITVKPLVDAYGFAADSAQVHPNIDSIMQFVGYKKIVVDGGKIIRPNGVQIDLNSIAKGHSVDLVAELIASKGVANYLVEIGGELFTEGVNSKGEKWNIGVDKPIDGNYSPGEELQTIVPLSGKGLASSGNYRRFHFDSDGNRVNHTIDPLTGKSKITRLLSVTVIAQNCMEADGYATALMSMGLEHALKFLESRPELSVYLVYDEKGEFKVFDTIHKNN